MSTRVQCTRVDGYVSGTSKLRCGTAQGSILKPLFFILFVNDIFAYVNYNKSLTMYANDTLLIEQGETNVSSMNACQHRLSEVETWCCQNKLNINIDKTKSMMICPKSTDIPCNVHLEISGKKL